MKIIKRGKLPKPKYEFRFECSHCGLIAVALHEEVKFVEDRGVDHPTLNCPTQGCGHVVYGKAIDKIWISQVMADIKSNHGKVPSWVKLVDV
jgi:hypothetical protein